MIPTNLTIQQPPQPTQSEQPTPPTPPPAEQTTPPNNEFVPIDELFNEFEVEKETTTTTNFETNADPGTAPIDETITATQNIYAAAPIDETITATQNIYAAAPVNIEKPPMDEATAIKETAKFMRFRENLQAYGIAYYADGSINSIDQYKYSPAQFNQLVEAWAPIVQTANIKLPPMADIALAEIMCTGPLIGLMNQNRKYRKEVEKLRKDNSKLQEQINKTITIRRDSKRFWEIGLNAKDVYGYFTHNPAGQYLRKEDRTERPELTEENIELLVKHNGKAAIDKLLNK